MGQDLVKVYITEDFRESVKTVLDDALNGQVVPNFEFPIYTKDKRRIEIMLNATPRCNVKGEVLDPDAERVAATSPHSPPKWTIYSLPTPGQITPKDVGFRRFWSHLFQECEIENLGFEQAVGAYQGEIFATLSADYKVIPRTPNPHRPLKSMNFYL